MQSIFTRVASWCWESTLGGIKHDLTTLVRSSTSIKIARLACIALRTQAAFDLGMSCLGACISVAVCPNVGLAWTIINSSQTINMGLFGLLEAALSRNIGIILDNEQKVEDRFTFYQRKLELLRNQAILNKVPPRSILTSSAHITNIHTEIKNELLLPDDWEPNEPNSMFNRDDFNTEPSTGNLSPN